MFSQSATAKAGKEVTLVSWIHSHVRGNRCGFSSVDVHTQLSMNFLFPKITGIVIEIDANGHCRKFDSYALTEIGEQVVKTCARTQGLGSELHSNCSNDAFFHSTLSNIELKHELPLTVTNFYQLYEDSHEF